MKAPAAPLLLLEAGLVVAWSSGFIGGKLAAETATLFLVLFWRFVAVALLLSPAVLAALRAGLTRRQIHRQLLIGALAMGVYLGAGLKAIELGVPAGLAALIAVLQPPLTAALAGPLLGERVSGRQWLGLGLGFLGVLLAVGGALGTAPAWAYGLCLLGMAGLTAATLLAKGSDDGVGLLPAIGLQSLVTALLFAPLAWLEGGLIPNADPGFLLAIGWFVVLSTFGGYGLYWLCLRRGTATRTASLLYLTPPVTMLWAWAMFGEPLSLWAALGFGLCLLGVWLARQVPTPSPHSPAAVPAGAPGSAGCRRGG